MGREGILGILTDVGNLSQSAEKRNKNVLAVACGTRAAL
jgi:hypothetical protein